MREKGAPVPAAPEVMLEEFANRPQPKVVDTTALPADLPTAKKKPSLDALKRRNKNGAVEPALTSAPQFN